MPAPHKRHTDKDGRGRPSLHEKSPSLLNETGRLVPPSKSEQAGSFLILRAFRFKS